MTTEDVMKLAKALGAEELQRCFWEGDVCTGKVPYLVATVLKKPSTWRTSESYL